MIGCATVADKPRDDSEASYSQPQGGATAKNVCLLGASLSTGNLGVSALAESSVKCILTRWPDARITLLGSSREEGTHKLRLGEREVVLREVPIRFCKNIFVSAHYGKLVFYALMVRLLPFLWMKRRLARHNAAFGSLLEADLFIDIAGGDSFSDIYGMRRLILGSLTRLLPLMLGKDLVMFPQTYGPFSRGISRCMARYVLKRAKCIYARDYIGLDYLKELLGPAVAERKARFAPDVAFVLDPRRPEKLDMYGLDAVRSDDSVVIGVNISGLIYYDGYRGRDEFGLNVNYRDMVDRIIRLFMANPDSLVLLVPHVMPVDDSGGQIENDLLACVETYDRLAQEYPGRIFVARSRYDQAQVKYIIGNCDFFVGTRMHSCIAALSQGVPAIGLAYSKKFAGVFETVEVEELVVDMRSATIDEAVAAVDRAFASRHATAECLRRVIPRVKQQVQALLQDMDSCEKG